MSKLNVNLKRNPHITRAERATIREIIDSWFAKMEADARSDNRQLAFTKAEFEYSVINSRPIEVLMMAQELIYAKDNSLPTPAHLPKPS